MCTALCYTDAAGKVYFGRTLELTVELPYQMAFFPVGLPMQSTVDGHPALAFTLRHALVAVTTPVRFPTPDAPLGIGDMKVVDGMNDAGLTFSLLSYPFSDGPQAPVAADRAVLSASDLGVWALGSFSTVAEVKAALAEQPVRMVALALLGGAVSPFHYLVNDASGASAVIEFNRGVMHVHDNPVRVMTNAPEFPWHLTNLANYTFLSNVDVSSATFGALKVAQPDAGIATAGLPSSTTAVGRFVRAAYYAQFTEKAATPDLAVRTVGHIMNNFDRPRGATIDYPNGGSAPMEVAGLADDKSTPYVTEYTSWTLLADLDRKQLHVRAYTALNYSMFDLTALAGRTTPKVVPLQALEGASSNATALLAA